MHRRSTLLIGHAWPAPTHMQQPRTQATPWHTCIQLDPCPNRWQLDCKCPAPPSTHAGCSTPDMGARSVWRTLEVCPDASFAEHVTRPPKPLVSPVPRQPRQPSEAPGSHWCHRCHWNLILLEAPGQPNLAESVGAGHPNLAESVGVAATSYPPSYRAAGRKNTDHKQA